MNRFFNEPPGIIHCHWCNQDNPIEDDKIIRCRVCGVKNYIVDLWDHLTGDAEELKAMERKEYLREMWKGLDSPY